MENREAVKGKKHRNGRCDAREANPRRPARTGVASGRKKARNGFGLLELVVENLHLKNQHLKAISALWGGSLPVRT